MNLYAMTSRQLVFAVLKYQNVDLAETYIRTDPPEENLVDTTRHLTKCLSHIREITLQDKLHVLSTTEDRHSWVSFFVEYIVPYLNKHGFAPTSITHSFESIYDQSIAS